MGRNAQDAEDDEEMPYRLEVGQEDWMRWMFKLRFFKVFIASRLVDLEKVEEKQ